jgi:hypothetical protein
MSFNTLSLPGSWHIIRNIFYYIFFQKVFFMKYPIQINQRKEIIKKKTTNEPIHEANMRMKSHFSNKITKKKR